MYRVTIGGYQLIIVTTNHLIVSKIGIASLRSSDREIVAQCVRIVLIKHIACPDYIPPTTGCLGSTHSHKLVGWYVIRQVTIAITNQHSWPDDRVEGNVIFANKVIGLNWYLTFARNPPGLPCFGITLAPCPFYLS